MSEEVRANPKAHITDTRFVDCEVIIEDDTAIHGNVFQNCKVHILESTANEGEENG